MKRPSLLVLCAVAAVVAAGCSPPRHAVPEEVRDDGGTPASSFIHAPPVGQPSPQTTEQIAEPATQPAAPPFESETSEIPAAVRHRMDGVSMQPGCPVGFDDLRYLRVSYWTFDSAPATGELVVHRDVADDVTGVFRRLYDARFPIRRMTLVDDFGRADDRADGADDFASIEADNTSAFNCRLRTGSAAEYSQHSYGTAVDVNPLENPYVSAGGTTAHKRSRPYLDRGTTAAGVISADGAAVEAFGSVGWVWGGTWSGARDFQHFSRNGR